MENETPSQGSSSKMLPIAIVAVVVIVIIAAVFMITSKSNEERQESPSGEQAEHQTAPTTTQAEVTTAPVTSGQYKNGSYKAVGHYISPGGSESIDVSLTLSNNVVTDAKVNSIKPSGPIARQMQAAFIDGFKNQVIGKKIDEINVTHVASSSLTPQGFMDAVSQIKQEASS